MALTGNNISVPTINYNLSGSVSDPIIQGTFQSSKSVGGQDYPSSIIDTAESGWDTTYYDASPHTYLRLNLGTIDDNGPIGALKSITGVYVQGTIQKVDNLSPLSENRNLRNTLTFEHFGNVYSPYLSGYYSSYPYVSTSLTITQLCTEFVIKSRTWSPVSGQAESVIDYLLNGGSMSNYSNSDNGLIYKDREEAFNPFPMFFEYTSDSEPLYLNCQIVFANPIGAATTLSGLFVKGTYLLV